MEVNWFHTEKRTCCSDCKKMVDAAWVCWQDKTAIMQLCDDCTTRRIA